MAKANRNAYKGGISPTPRENIQTGELIIDCQTLDNLNLKPVNRVGIPGNKHVGVNNV